MNYLLIHNEYCLIVEHNLSMWKTKALNKYSKDKTVKNMGLAQVGKALTYLYLLQFPQVSD